MFTYTSRSILMPLHSYALHICRHARVYTQQRRKPGRFLECVEENFLTQLVSKPRSLLLDLLLANRGLVMWVDVDRGDVRVGCCSGHSDHEIKAFDSRRSKDGGYQNCYLGLPEGRLSCLGDLRNNISWEAFLKGKGAQEGCPCMPEDDLVWKIGLAEQRTEARAQEEKDGL